MKYTSQYLKDLTDIQECIPQIELLKGTKIFVSGSGGLIGSAIVDFLLQLNDTRQYGITVFSAARSKIKIYERFGKYSERKDFVFVEYDALKPISLKESPDYIIHAASPANPAMYIDQPVETMMSNILGIKYALDYARDKQVKRVLYISSSEVYGKKLNDTAYMETEYGYLDILNPRACYPSSKRAAETICTSYMKEYSVESVIVRPGHIYGGSVTEEDNRASSQFLKDAASGKNIIMKSLGMQIRSYCYVCDGVSSIFTVLLNGKPGMGYNISNPNSICTIRELAECIAAESNSKLLFDVPSDKEKSSYNLMTNSSVDSNELIKLGWKAIFDLHTGINHSLEILKQ